MQKQVELLENEARALAYLARSGGEVYGLSTLSTPLDMSKEGVRKLCRRLEERGYMTVHPEPEGTRICATRKGYQVIHPHLDRVDGELSTEDSMEPLDVHYVTVVCSIRNREHLDDEWRGRWTEASNYKWAYDFQNDTYSSPVGVVDQTLFRFHRETVEIVVKRPGTGYNVSNVVQQVHDRIDEAVQWVNRRTPAEVNMHRVDVVTAHAAILRDPMAQLVDELGLDRDAFKIIDKETGKVRAEIEASKGIPELEFKGGDTALQDVRSAFEEFYGAIAHEPHVIEALVERGRELADREEKSDRVEAADTVGKTHEQIADNYSYDDWNTFG